MKSLKKIALELGIFLYLAVALGFVYKEHKQLACSQIDVEIVDESANYFVEEQDVISIVNQKGDQGVGIVLNEIRIKELEDEIKKNPSIADADVFRCIDGRLKVSVVQRRPILRVINYNRDSYYLDSEGAMMPLSRRYTARVPVATGNLNVPFSNDVADVRNQNDELGRQNILPDLYELAKMIDGDAFYSSLVEQVHVDSDNQFYLVPKIGPKIIEFGGMENAENKFFKLTALYRSGLPLKGWDRYQKINLKFKNQVVCTK